MGRAPNLVELGIFSVMWSEHCSYKSTRAHLRTLPTKAPWVLAGPGRECRRDRHRRRRCRHLQDGKPQPSVLHRALSGRGDGRGRHHARRLHHGRAPHRDDERAALRRARSSQDPASRVRRRLRHRRLWQLHGRADGGRRSEFPPLLQRQHPGQRDVRGACAHRQDFQIGRQRARAIRSSMSARRRAATAFMAPPWRRRNSTKIPKRSARPCRWAIRSPKSCCSKPASN